MARVFDSTEEQSKAEGIDRAVSALGSGNLVVIPTDTVYGIAADAFSPRGVQSLLAAKHRGRSMPPPVLIGSSSAVQGIARDIPAEAHELIDAFWPGALTLILWAQPSLSWDLGDTNGTVAVRCPDHGVARELLSRTGPLAVSSANISGKPPARSAAEAENQLGEVVRVILADDGDSAVREASTIVDCTVTPPALVRPGAISLAALREVVPTLLAARIPTSDQAVQSGERESAKERFDPPEPPEGSDS